MTKIQSYITMSFFILLITVLGACTPQSQFNGINETEIDSNQSVFTPVNQSQNTGLKPATPSEIHQNDITTYVFSEGDYIQLNPNMAYDPDGSDVSLTFSEPFNQTGGWVTTYGDAGNYTITIAADDGTLQSTRTLIIEVLASNQPPVISNFENITVAEGTLISLNPTVYDPDGDNVTINYSGWMTSPTYQTTYNDAGVYNVTVTANDGKQPVSQTITLTVSDTNRPPEFTSLNDITATEGDFVQVRPQVFDPDDDNVTVTFSRPLDIKNGSWQTQVGDADKYIVTATVTDGKAIVTETFQLNIIQANQPPVISNITDITVNETDTITLSPVVFDPNNDEVAIEYSGWMNSSTYTTTYGDAGEHKVTLIASDGIEQTQQTITITVLKVNRPPIFADDVFI